MGKLLILINLIRLSVQLLDYAVYICCGLFTNIIVSLIANFCSSVFVVAQEDFLSSLGPILVSFVKGKHMVVIKNYWIIQQ